MSGSAAVAISAVASAQAAIAAQQASEARRASCVDLVQMFDARRAAVPDMQAYASCVQLLYPSEVAPTMVDRIIVGAVIVFLLVSMTIGARRFSGARNPDLGDYLIGAGLGLTAAAAALCVVGLFAFLASKVFA